MLNLNQKKNIIGLTSGEPAGIGTELIDSLIHKYISDFSNIQLMYIGDLNLLQKETQNYFKNQGLYHQIDVNVPVKLGVLDANNNSYVLQTLSQATQLALNNQIDAIVTLPVHKGILNTENTYFSGHTEFFAQQSGLKNDDVLMLLAGESKNNVNNSSNSNNSSKNTLRVALVTTHIPLKSVAEHLSQEKLIHVLTLLHQGLKSQFQIKNPKIHVCGLNPHAGDDGALGTEEQTIISPAIKIMQERGFDVQGPFSADTVFHHQNVDAFLAMYHDQGLPVLKYATFGHAVNMTLGLPFIRTSVDHGTAVDIAGKGIADIGSLMVALETAIHCARLK